MLPPTKRLARRRASAASLLGALLAAAPNCALEPWTYQPRGPTHVWSHVYGSPSNGEIADGIAVDAELSVYITGFVEGPVDFGGGIRAPGAVGHGEVFLAAIDGTGDHLWSLRPLGAYGSAAVLRNADVCVTGNFWDRMVMGDAWDVGGDAAGAQDLFLACVDRTTGVESTGRRLGGTGTEVGASGEQGFAAVVDATGNVYVGGIVRGPVAVPFAGEAFVGGNAAILSYGPDTSARWARSLASPDGGLLDRVNAVAVDDATGRLFAAGSFSGAVDPGRGPETSRGATDAFVAAYDLSGAPLWQRAFGDTRDDYAEAVVAGAGLVVVGGWYDGRPRWYTGTTEESGPAAVTTDAGDRGFVAVFDATTGSLRDMVTFRGWLDGLALDQPRRVLYLTGGGYAPGELDLGGGALPNHGFTDVILWSLDLELGHRWSLRLGGPGEDYGRHVAFAGRRVCATGFTQGGGATFGGATFAGVGASDIFVACYDE